VGASRQPEYRLLSDRVQVHVHHAQAARIAAILREIAPRPAPWVIVPLDDEAALHAAMPEMRVLFAPMPPRAGWTRATQLQLVQLAGAGVDHFLPSPDLPPGVVVANARGVFADEAADHAMMMVLALTRRLPRLLQQQRARRWEMLPMPKLAGRTLLVLGLGEIGRRVASRAAAFGMRVLGVRRSGVATPCVDEVHPAVDAALVARADAVVVALPRTSETDRVVPVDALRPEAVLVDISRGGRVDADAVAARLRAGTLAGAALDVFEDEPLAGDSPLWDTPNLFITPHIAGYGERYLERAALCFAENLARLERGDPLTGVVDRNAGY